MTLTLSVLRCPDAVPPETRRVTGGDFSIGRGSDADWPLADPERILSKRHCTLEYRGGQWQVRDTSSNGTFVNRDPEPIGNGRVRELRDGDRLRMGSYELEVRVEEDAAFTPSTAPRPMTSATSLDPFDDSLFGAKPAPPPPFGGARLDQPFGPADEISIGQGGPRGNAGGSPLLPDDFDLGFGTPSAAPTVADHAPAGEAAFTPPKPARSLLPDDDDDWLAPLSPPATTPAAAPAPPPIVPAPVLSPPVVPPPLPALADTASPFDEPLDTPPKPVSMPRQAPAAAPAQAVPEDAALLAAFLQGAQIDAEPIDPPTAMRNLGAAFRALVGGLRQTLIARATIKGEFRIEQTMVRARGNNPLKFSAGDDDALVALLGAGRRTDMTPQQAVADALRDIRLHELAVMAAMQAAVRSLLARMDPAPLRAEAERAGGLLPAQRRARAFEAYEKLHGDITQGLVDDFDRVFGRAFAQAYEQALREAAQKDAALKDGA